MHVAYESSPFSLRTVWNLRNLLGRGDYDIVHTHEYKSNALVRLLRSRRRHRVVATAHGYNQTTFREGFYYALEWRIFRGVDAIIAPTREMADFLIGKGVHEEEIHVIHNGIEVSGRQRPVPVPGNGALRLLYLGRLSPEKDPANLLDAIGLLRSRGLAVRATLAGDGPERAALEQQVRAMGLSEVVELPGFVSEIMPLLARADILVNPSRTECMPNAVLEAMWAGVPVVATRVGGVAEMIRDGTDGLLVPSGDPAALANGIASLADDADGARRLASSAYRRVMEEFSFERRMERVMDLYAKILSGQTRRQP
jgi:glycosyltransferase involved in cell wall biosynthesis